MNLRCESANPNREAVATSRRRVSRPPAVPRFFVSLGVLMATAAFACTIPVFRFALDRWEADAFRLVIPASWATQPDMIRLLVPLRGNGEANVKIEESTDAALADAKLLFPRDDTPLWSGKLDATTLPPILDSPARRELLKRILSGESVVWVVCTKDADKAEADRIEKRLAFLEKVATLPPQDPSDPDSQLGPGPPLKLKFTVLRVSLDDPNEKLFAAMMAGPKQQDFIARGTSFAGPVFAKGRVLGSWPVAELDDTAIEDASLFLVGRCSCRIKNENPGWDVVLKTDWEHSLAEAGEAAEHSDPESSKPRDGAASVQDTPPLEERVQALEAYVASPSPAVKPAAAHSATYVQFSLSWPILGTVVAAVLVVVSAVMLFARR